MKQDRDLGIREGVRSYVGEFLIAVAHRVSLVRLERNRRTKGLDRVLDEMRTAHTVYEPSVNFRQARNILMKQGVNLE